MYSNFSQPTNHEKVKAVSAISLPFLDKTITTFCHRGTVLEEKKHSETNVYSTGGGGYVGNQGGYVSSPTIHSSVTTTQEIWIKTPSGSEKSLTLINRDVNIRASHEVSMVYASIDNGNNGYPVCFINHTTNQFRTLQDSAGLDKLLGLTKKLAKPRNFRSLFSIRNILAVLSVTTIILSNTLRFEAGETAFALSYIAVPYLIYYFYYLFKHTFSNVKLSSFIESGGLTVAGIILFLLSLVGLAIAFPIAISIFIYEYFRKKSAKKKLYASLDAFLNKEIPSNYS